MDRSSYPMGPHNDHKTAASGFFDLAA